MIEIVTVKQNTDIFVHKFEHIIICNRLLSVIR
jgi:hypothetical protein